MPEASQPTAPSEALSQIELAQQSALKKGEQAIEEAQRALQELEHRLEEIKRNFQEEIKRIGATAAKATVEPPPSQPESKKERPEDEKTSRVTRLLSRLPTPIAASLPRPIKKRLLRREDNEPEEPEEEPEKDEGVDKQTPPPKAQERTTQPLEPSRVRSQPRRMPSRQPEQVRREKAEEKRSRSKKAAVALGALVVGTAGVYVAAKLGTEPSVPGFFETFPDFNPDLAEELIEEDVPVPVVERIYGNLNLYERLLDAGISRERIIDIFERPELIDGLQAPELSEQELANVFDNPDNFVELGEEASLEPETAAKIFHYPELVEIWENEGFDSPLIQAISRDEELFQWLVDIDAEYTVMKDVMLNADQLGEALSALEENDIGVEDLPELIAEADEPLEEPEPAVAPERFDIEYGHGYTQELRDYVENLGESLTPEGYMQLHLDLRERFGIDYLRGVPKYRLPASVPGEFGLARPGVGWWENGVEAHIREFVGVE